MSRPGRSDAKVAFGREKSNLSKAHSQRGKDKQVPL